MADDLVTANPSEHDDNRPPVLTEPIYTMYLSDKIDDISEN